mgnify:FL=1
MKLGGIGFAERPLNNDDDSGILGGDVVRGGGGGGDGVEAGSASVFFS